MTSIFLHSRQPVLNENTFKANIASCLGLGTKTNAEIEAQIDRLATEAKSDAFEGYDVFLECDLELSKEESTILVEANANGTYVIIDGDVSAQLNACVKQTGKAKNDVAVVFSQSIQSPLNAITLMSLSDVTCALKNSTKSDCQNFASKLTQVEQYPTLEEAIAKLPKGSSNVLTPTSNAGN